MVEVTDTIPGKHAVMLPLEDTLTTGGAMPGSGRGDGLAHSTVVPVFSPGIGRQSIQDKPLGSAIWAYPSLWLDMTMCLVLVSTSLELNKSFKQKQLSF